MSTNMGLLTTIQGINFYVSTATEFTLIFVMRSDFSPDKRGKKILVANVYFCYGYLERRASIAISTGGYSGGARSKE